MSILSRAANKLQPGKTLLVPKNKFKVADEEWGHLPEYVVPAANKIVHPFYQYPNATERTALCITERNPKLFNGKPVLPAFVRHPVTSESTLVESRLSFDTVKDVSKWVQRIHKSGDRLFHKVNITSSDSGPKVRKTKMTSESPFVKQLDNFLNSHPQLSFETLDSELSKLFIFHKGQEVIYLEEIFLYILQRDNLTVPQWKATLKTLPKYVGKEIDDIDMLNTLLIQWVLSGEQLFTKIDTPALNLLWNVIKSSRESLNQNIITNLNNVQLNKLFDTFLKGKDIKVSRILLETLASRRIMPSLPSIEEYIELVGQAGQETDAGIVPLERKSKLYLLHVLSPVFASNLTCRMTDLLLPYCIHQSEIFALLDLALKSKYSKDIAKSCVNNFVLRIAQLKDSQVDNSLNISSLYYRIKAYNNGTVPKANLLAFIIALLTNSNFRAVQTIINEQPVKEITKVIEVVKNQTTFIDQFGFTGVDRETLLHFLNNRA